MQKHIWVLLLACISTYFAYAQPTDYADSKPISIAYIKPGLPIHKQPPVIYLKNYVETRIATWQEKGEFEKTSAWQQRVNAATRRQKAKEFQKEAEALYQEAYAKHINWNQFSLGAYDADNESFLISSRDFGEFALAVAISDAPAFKKSWATIRTQDPIFVLSANKISLSKLSFLNPSNNKIYTYDAYQSQAYASAEISYNFAPLEIDLEEDMPSSNQNIGNKQLSIGRAEVDLHIPQTEYTQPNTFVVIISNEDYAREVKVDYAINDGAVFRDYCKKTLGIPAENIRYRANATYGEMLAAKDWLLQVAKAYAGKARLLFYYAGHGVPDEATREAYLLPTDGYASNLSAAISLDDLYQAFSQSSALRTTVLLDACFSGSIRAEGMLASARGVRIKPKASSVAGNLVVFSATREDETAYPYPEKQHGLFTYYLLKKLQETQGELNYGEMASYLKTQVGRRAIVINQKPQTPQVQVGSPLREGWKALTF